MSNTFRVVLRDVNGFEGIASREFELSLASKFPIGRASKNTTKKDLMPAANNAYIDSPVISREHAVLTVNADSGAPYVYITDKNSMHGTFLNGEKLEIEVPKLLASGDKLQFGVDVNRGEEFFAARKYQFDAQLVRPETNFSRGFTVPDSDEEDVGDYESDASAADNAEVTLMGEGFIVEDDEDEDELEPPAVAEVHLHRESSSDPAGDVSLILENFSDNEGSGGYYSSDVQDDLEDDLMGGSEASFDSDRSELLAKEADADPEAFKRKMMEDFQSTLPIGLQQHLAPNDAIPEPQNVFDEMDVPSMDSQLEDIHQSFKVDFSNAYPPPLPPRPQAAQPNNVGMPSNSRPPWYSDNSSAYAPVHGDRPVLFSPAPPPVPFIPSAQDALASAWNFAPPIPPAFAPFANRMQTPPAVFQTGNAMPTTPPPHRRTKVSIGEIVEEQPLTPTSDNEMKRKADVLDEPDVIQAMSEPAQDVHAKPAAVPEPVEDNTAQTAAIIAQRPKKEPRSILARVRTTAKYLGVGAAGAVSAVVLLSSLPDAFFA